MALRISKSAQSRARKIRTALIAVTLLTIVDGVANVFGIAGVTSMWVALALLLFLWAIGILSILLSYPERDISNSKIAGITAFTIGFTLIGYFIVQKQPKPEIEYNGTLAPTPDSIQPSSSPLFTVQGKSELTIIEIGDSCLMFDWRGEEGKPILEFMENSSLTIERIDGHLKVSTKIFGRDGRFVARLNQNVWDVNPKTSYQLNYTSEALEVIDDYDRVVLQVRVLPDRVQLQGEWWNDRGQGMRIMKGPDLLSAIFIHLGVGNPHEKTHTIKPIFKYPAKDHLGETDIILLPAPSIHVCREACKALKGNPSATCFPTSP